MRKLDANLNRSLDRRKIRNKWIDVNETDLIGENHIFLSTGIITVHQLKNIDRYYRIWAKFQCASETNVKKLLQKQNDVGFDSLFSFERSKFYHHFFVFKK